MLSLRRILVPVDFSERSTAAAEHAAVIARRFGSSLVFLHAVPPGPYHQAVFPQGFSIGEVYPPREDVEAGLRSEMQALTEKLGGGLAVETLIAWGDPATEIEKVAGRAEMGLIVMPTHGFGPFRRYLLGSVTTKVLHDLTTPVLTGAHVEEISPSAVEPYKRIGCAVDLSEHSEQVLAWASDFAASSEAEGQLIHASDAGGAPALAREVQDGLAALDVPHRRAAPPGAHGQPAAVGREGDPGPRGAARLLAEPGDARAGSVARPQTTTLSSVPTATGRSGSAMRSSALGSLGS